MKILFISPYAPTPIRTRPFNFIRALKNAGQDVSLATNWENSYERQSLNQLANEGIEVIETHLTRPRILFNLGRAIIINTPWQSQYSFNPTLAKKIVCFIRDYYQNCDIIHIEHLRGASYGLYIKKYFETLPFSVPIIWDSVDNISALFEQAAHNNQGFFGRVITRFELPRTRRFETFLTSQFEGMLVTSKLDKEAFERLHGGTLQNSKIEVVTNGVDYKLFSPPVKPRQADVVVYSGKLSYHANVASALFLIHEIMPIIWQSRPSVKIMLV